MYCYIKLIFALPLFNIDVENCPLFCQQFKSMIHDNMSLADSEKNFYLVGKLTGQASCVFRLRRAGTHQKILFYYLGSSRTKI